MVLDPDHFPKQLAAGVRWGVFSALVAWAIVTWDKPERVMLPAMLGAIILGVCFYIERHNSAR